MKGLALSLLVLAIALALAGCAGGGAHSKTSGSKPKPAVLVPRYGSAHSLRVVVDPKILIGRGIKQLHGARLLSPTRLAILTSGSSSCPEVPDRLVVQTPHTIRIDLTMGSWRRAGGSGQMELAAQPPKGPCLADLTGFPVVVSINPKQIDVHHRVTVSLYYPLSKHPVVFTAPPL